MHKKMMGIWWRIEVPKKKKEKISAPVIKIEQTVDLLKKKKGCKDGKSER